MKPSASLAVLVERLRWPVPRVRWEAARQLATLIRAGDQQSVEIILKWAAKQELEADSLILPSLIFAFNLGDCFTFDEVHAATMAPSVLSDALLSEIYPTNSGRLFSFRLRYGKGPPQPSNDESLFDEGMGTIIPLIFRSTLLSLQRRTGFPFLERWRDEWCALRSIGKEPYTLVPGFFFAGSRGEHVSLDVRQRAVFTSAFLRALSFAHLEWKMPQPAALDLAELALPFNRDLSRFTASPRPSWSQDFLTRFKADGTSALARSMWRSAALGLDAGFEPIAINVIDHSELLAVHIQVHRVFAGQEPDFGSQPDLADMLWISPQGDRWSLDGPLPMADNSADLIGLRSLSVAVHPAALGRAHIDPALGHLLIADPLLASGAATLTCENERVVMADALGPLSILKLWYADWKPAHPEQLHWHGSLTTCRSASLRDLRRGGAVKTPRLVRSRVGRRRHRYDPYEFTTRTFIL